MKETEELKDRSDAELQGMLSQMDSAQLASFKRHIHNQEYAQRCLFVGFRQDMGLRMVGVRGDQPGVMLQEYGFHTPYGYELARRWALTHTDEIDEQ